MKKQKLLNKFMDSLKENGIIKEDVNSKKTVKRFLCPKKKTLKEPKSKKDNGKK